MPSSPFSDQGPDGRGGIEGGSKVERVAITRDGSRVAYTGRLEGRAGLYAVDIDATNAQQLTTPANVMQLVMDREGQDPIDIMDEVEEVLKIKCAPMSWPIGIGKSFVGVYRLYDDAVHLFAGRGSISEDTLIQGLDNPQ